AGRSAGCASAAAPGHVPPHPYAWPCRRSRQPTDRSAGSRRLSGECGFSGSTFCCFQRTMRRKPLLREGKGEGEREGKGEGGRGKGGKAACEEKAAWLLTLHAHPKGDKVRGRWFHPSPFSLPPSLPYPFPLLPSPFPFLTPALS